MQELRTSTADREGCGVRADVGALCASQPHNGKASAQRHLQAQRRKFFQNLTVLIGITYTSMSVPVRRPF